MSKSKWYKNKLTGEVVLQTGSNRQNMGTVFYRVRAGETFSETKSKFFSSHTQIEASGFPAERSKEFKPRYAVSNLWTEGEAFVVEFEPAKFKIVMKDGREISRDGDACNYFTKFFDQGLWQVVSEAEAKARLNKPAPPVPAAEQFDYRGKYYGHGGQIYQGTGYGHFAVYQRDGDPRFFTQFTGTVDDSVVRHLWEMGMVITVKPEPAKPPEKPKKKILVEWAVSLGAEGPYIYELYPVGRNVTLPNSFRTGRTVEVPE